MDEKHICVRVSFEIGHEASIRNKRTPEGFTHDWEVFVRGADNTDISHFVEKVVFYLHDTFPKPKRVVKESPYSVKESGYAGFNLPIDVYFKNHDEPKKVRFNYDLHLQPSGPSISKVLREKYIFPNPAEDLRRRLIKGGGVGVVGSEASIHLASIEKPSIIVSASDEASSNKHSVPPLVGKPKLGGDTTKKHKVKEYRPEEPRVSNSFADLFGPPIKTAKVSPDPKKSSHSPKVSPVPKPSKPIDKVSSDKQVSGSKSAKHIPQKEVKDAQERSSSTKDEKRDKTKERDKSKEKPPKRPSSPPKHPSTPPKRPSTPPKRPSTPPKRPLTPPKHQITPSKCSSTSPKPTTPKSSKDESKKSTSDESKGKSDSKPEVSKSEKKKKDKKSRDEKPKKDKHKEHESKVSDKVGKSEKSSKDSKDKDKDVVKKLEKEVVKEPDKPRDKERDKTKHGDGDKDKQRHKHKKKEKSGKERDKDRDKDKDKEKEKDRDKSGKKSSESRNIEVKDKEKNGIVLESSRVSIDGSSDISSSSKKQVARNHSLSPSPVRTVTPPAKSSSTPEKPAFTLPPKDKLAKRPLNMLLSKISDEDSDCSSSLLSGEEDLDSPVGKTKIVKLSPLSESSTPAPQIETKTTLPPPPPDTLGSGTVAKVNNKTETAKTKSESSNQEKNSLNKSNSKPKDKSASKKNKDKKEENSDELTKDSTKVGKDVGKKKKRKNSNKGEDAEEERNNGESASKVMKLDAEPVKVEETPVVKESELEAEQRIASAQLTAEYVSQLKELQHKIMTLEDNEELQRVVQVIAETGQYEITKKTFDFDLCALDRSTVKRLQDFFTAS